MTTLTLKIGERTFYVVDVKACRLSDTLKRPVFGPWAVIENNGGGMLPVVIREGISGTRENAIRVMQREVAAITDYLPWLALAAFAGNRTEETRPATGSPKSALKSLCRRASK